MKKERLIDRIINHIFDYLGVYLIISGLIIVGIFVGYKSYQENKSFDEFCREKGFIGHLDSKRDIVGKIYPTLQIECYNNENKEIFYAQERTECLKYDKWGDCINHKTVIN